MSWGCEPLLFVETVILSLGESLPENSQLSPPLGIPMSLLTDAPYKRYIRGIANNNLHSYSSVAYDQSSDTLQQKLLASICTWHSLSREQGKLVSYMAGNKIAAKKCILLAPLSAKSNRNPYNVYYPGSRTFYRKLVFGADRTKAANKVPPQDLCDNLTTSNEGCYFFYSKSSNYGGSRRMGESNVDSQQT